MNPTALLEEEILCLQKSLKNTLLGLHITIEPDQGYRFFKFCMFKEKCLATLKRAENLYRNEIKIIQYSYKKETVTEKLQFYIAHQKALIRLNSNLIIVEKDIKTFRKDYKI